MKNRFILIAIISALIYLPSIFGGFMWDDEEMIAGDPVIHSVSNAGKVFSTGYWRRDFPGAENRYRPARSLALMAEWKAFGASPTGYHAVNLLLNAAAGCLALWLSLLLFKDPDKAFVSALIFSLHPVHVESVAWVKNMSDMLMFIFCAVSAAVFLSGRETGRKSSRAVSLLFFSLALASKEGAMALPLLLFGWLVMLCGEKPKAAFRELMPMLSVAAAFLAFVLLSLRRSAAMSPVDPVGSILAFLQYSRLVFLPYGLNAEHVLVTIYDLSGIIISAGLLAYGLRGGGRRLIYALVWAFVCLIPVLDVRLMTGRPVAEQRLYMAVLGVGFVAGELYKPVRAWKYGIAAAALVLGALSVARNFEWINPVRFWEGTVKASPSSPRAHNNLGVSYERASRPADAAREYGVSARLAPLEESPYLNIADLLSKSGRMAEAERAYSEIYAKRPGSRRAALGLLRIKLDEGKLDEARPIAEALLAAEPEDAEAVNSVGVVYMLSGRGAEAAEAFERAIRLNPEYVDAYYNLAGIYRDSGRLDLAAAAYERLLKVAPGHLDALNNLGIINDIRGNEAGAIEYFKMAERADPAYGRASYNLGGIYYRKKMYLDALSAYTRALSADPKDSKAASKVGEIRKILDEKPGK